MIDIVETDLPALNMPIRLALSFPVDMSPITDTADIEVNQS